METLLYQNKSLHVLSYSASKARKLKWERVLLYWSKFPHWASYIDIIMHFFSLQCRQVPSAFSALNFS